MVLVWEVMQQAWRKTEKHAWVRIMCVTRPSSSQLWTLKDKATQQLSIHRRNHDSRTYLSPDNWFYWFVSSRMFHIRWKTEEEKVGWEMSCRKWNSDLLKMNLNVSSFTFFEINWCIKSQFCTRYKTKLWNYTLVLTC